MLWPQGEGQKAVFPSPKGLREEPGLPLWGEKGSEGRTPGAS